MPGRLYFLCMTYFFSYVVSTWAHWGFVEWVPFLYDVLLFLVSRHKLGLGVPSICGVCVYACVVLFLRL